MARMLGNIMMNSIQVFPAYLQVPKDDIDGHRHHFFYSFRRHDDVI